jgi:hypothetical protein
MQCLGRQLARGLDRRGLVRRVGDDTDGRYAGPCLAGADEHCRRRGRGRDEGDSNTERSDDTRAGSLHCRSTRSGVVLVIGETAV